MAADSLGKGLIDPRRISTGLEDLARAVKVPLPAVKSKLPASELLRLGRVSGFAGLEHTELGEAAMAMVLRFNAFKQSKGEYVQAVSFAEYLDRRAHPIRRRGEVDELDRPEFTKNFQGYLVYLCDLDPLLNNALSAELERPVFIQESLDRHAHTLVTGGSRSGKTELLKLLIHHYVKHPELGGVLVIDPHGDMARQIARWQEFKGKGSARLVYLDAAEGLEHGQAVPALNPLVRGSATPDELATLSGQLADALAYFGGEGEGQTPQMQRLGAFCLQVLLEIEGSTLVDLMHGLTVPARREKGGPKPQEVEFVKRGKAHPDEIVREFFRNDFEGESYRTTRDALKRRLSTHLRAPKFRRMMVAPNPANVEALLNAGKVVVVNCSLEGDAGDALGRFMVAQVAAIGRRRLDNPRLERHPVHVFVDEATQLMAPPFVKILERFAKTKIWLTMAQQGAGEGAEREFVNRVKRSTLLKFIGRSGSLGDVLRQVDIGRGEVPMLKQGQFLVAKTGEEKMPMLLEVLNPSPLADKGNTMSEGEFAKVMAGQLAAYYRQEAKALPAPVAMPAGEADDWVNE